ncbi:MAG: omega-amidase [Pirellulaceae bacterium]
MDMVWQEKPTNHDKVRKLLAGANLAENALIILPEMFDTGFSMNVLETAQTEMRESESFVRELAAEFKAAVLAGVTAPIANGQSANEAVAFAPDGSELVRYHKMHPFTPSGEHEKYGAGTAHQIFSWQDFKIAPFICYDLRFPEVFRPAALAGAELMPVIASWPQARSEHWVRLLQARAIENQAFTVGVNRCGTDPALSYDGRSTAFDPQGASLFEANGDEQVCVIDIDVAEVREWRAQFPALRDCRTF